MLNNAYGEVSLLANTIHVYHRCTVVSILHDLAQSATVPYALIKGSHGRRRIYRSMSIRFLMSIGLLIMFNQAIGRDAGNRGMSSMSERIDRHLRSPILDLAFVLRATQA